MVVIAPTTPYPGWFDILGKVGFPGDGDRLVHHLDALGSRGSTFVMTDVTEITPTGVQAIRQAVDWAREKRTLLLILLPARLAASLAELDGLPNLDVVVLDAAA